MFCFRCKHNSCNKIKTPNVPLSEWQDSMVYLWLKVINESDRRVATLFTGGLADGLYHEFKVKVYICVVTNDLIQ